MSLCFIGMYVYSTQGREGDQLSAPIWKKGQARHEHDCRDELHEHGQTPSPVLARLGGGPEGHAVADPDGIQTLVPGQESFSRYFVDDGGVDSPLGRRTKGQQPARL